MSKWEVMIAIYYWQVDINKMKIIRLFCVNIIMHISVTKAPRLTLRLFC